MLALENRWTTAISQQLGRLAQPRETIDGSTDRQLWGPYAGTCIACYHSWTKGTKWRLRLLGNLKVSVEKDTALASIGSQRQTPLMSSKALKWLHAALYACHDTRLHRKSDTHAADIMQR